MVIPAPYGESRSDSGCCLPLRSRGINQRSGMVVDLKAHKAIPAREVPGVFDHRFLNEEVLEFRSCVPPPGNLCLEIHRILNEGWKEPPPSPKARLQGVHLEETHSDFFRIQ